MYYFILLLMVFILYIGYQVSFYKVNTINLKSEKIKDEIRILQISDFHNSKLVNLKRLAKDIKLFNPDLICLTGDIISRDTKDDQIFKKFLSTFSAYKTFFVSGNHELENKYIDYKNILGEYKIIDISSENLDLNIRDNLVSIYGLDFGENNLKDTFNSKFNILLCHNPDTFVNSNKNGYDLVLSGHNHGGQVCLPIFGQVIDHDLNLFPKYSSGLYKLYGSNFYISRGLGQKIKFRINCRIAIEEIIIKNIHSK